MPIRLEASRLLRPLWGASPATGPVAGAMARWMARGVALIVFTGLGVTAWTVLAMQRSAQQQAAGQFEGHVSRLEREIITRIERAEYGLRGMRSAMIAQPRMQRSQFEAVVGSRDLWVEFRGVRGFGFIERVERPDLDRFIAARRAEGSPDFQVRTAGDAPDLFVIRYIEPLATNRQALGFDLGSDPHRREALATAAAQGAATLTPRVTLVQDERRGAGLVYVLPLHENNADGSTERGRLIGFVHAPIVAAEILGDLQSFVEFLLDIRLYEGRAAEGRPIYDTQRAIDPHEVARPDDSFSHRLFTAERQFSIGGRLFTLQAASKPALEAPLVSLARPSVVVAAIGTLLTAMLALAAYLLMRGRARALGLAQRITADLEKTSSDLAFSNQRLQAVLDNLPCGLSVFDRDLQPVAHNALLLRLLGVADAQPLPALDFLPGGDEGPAGADGTLSLDRQLLQRPHRFERTLDDGTHLEIHAGPMPDGGFVMTYVDITSRRQAEDALRQSESLIRLVADNIPGRIVYWDPEGQCRFANREFLTDHGLQAQDLLGRHWHTVYGNADPLRAERIARTLAGERLIFEKEEVDAQGRRQMRLVHYVPQVEAGTVRGFFALGLDITELRTARDDALRASEAKSRFVANMSHELRTPMNAVLGMLQLMQLTPLTSQQQDYAAKAEGAAKALLSVLNDILDFSKVEAGKMTLDPREFELDQLLRDLSVIFASSLGTKPVEFIFDLDPRVPARLVADDMRLRQVLINLGGNAIKFTGQGEVVLRMAEAGRQAGSVTLAISVTDTGIGIPAQSLQRLFQDFGQAEASTTRRFGGTGLGLAICRKLVALMGGELSVTSQEGLGSCFSFQIQVPWIEEGAPIPAPLRVLVADGCERTGQLHADMGRNLGWEVVRAHTGDRALAAATGPHRFDAVLVDWMMDSDVPLAIARQLGEALDGRGTALVVLGTGEINELMAQLEPSRQRHISACLARPVTARMLAQAVAEGRQRPAPAAAGNPGGPALQGLRLLVAEDNENNQLVARELLESQGAQVVIADDGVEAVRLMREDGAFDAILMDWQMPRMDGLQACAQIRAMGRFDALPVIAMTANAMDSDRATCLAAGMDDHVAKPFVLAKLVETLLLHTRGIQPASAPGEPRSGEGPASPVEAGGPELLDRAGAIEQLGGSMELYEQLLPLFRSDLESTLQAVAQAAAGQGDAQQARRQAHTLKGTAGTLGAHYLADIARQAEAALDAGNPQAMAEAALTLRLAADRTLEALDA